jgi:four helix bundle protein
MARIDRFEDLIAWQKARVLAGNVYGISQSGDLSKDFGLRDQIRRSAVSVMANVAEGFERGGRREFHQFLSTAKASCAELRSHLYVASDAGYLGKEEFRHLMDQAQEVSRILGGLRAAVSEKPKGGLPS